MNAWLLALLAVAAFAQPPAEGVKRYDAGDYTGAATAFDAALAAQPREPAWHYDRGNALIKAGRLGPAIAAYERAFALAPRDNDIRFNLDFALRRAGEELVPPGVPTPLFSLFHWLSAAELSGLFWLACWASLSLAAAWLLRPDRRQALQPWAALAFGAWAACALWGGARRAIEPGQRGVVSRSTAELRSGPGDGFSVSFTVPEGRRVEILSDGGAWLEVGLLKEGSKGWVKAEAVEKIYGL